MSEPSRRRAFRWQGLFQGAAEAVFVLDRRRRLLFVNECLEQLTGLSLERVRGLLCRRPRAPAGDVLAEDVLAYLLTPPPEVLTGTAARVRRLYPGQGWWDIEFMPLRQEEGCAVVGRILPLPVEPGAAEALLPERLMALRGRAAGRYSLELLDSRVPAMVRLVRQVRLAMDTRCPILLVGETGVGKETIGRIIHYQGRDRESAFASLDCERLPTDAIAAMLLADAPGVGTLYLRQPAALPREMQMLLCQRLSGERVRPRVIAGSTMPVGVLVREGRFLEELAGLLSPLTIEVPPLRERREDLPRLVERMLARLGEPIHLTPAAWEVLRGHSWPANLTELFEVLADSRERANQGRLDASELPASLRIRGSLALEASAPAKQPPLAELLEQVERRMIEVALRRARGNRTKASEALGIQRNQLLRRMKALGIEEGEEGS